jgi:hypothetical protein
MIHAEDLGSLTFTLFRKIVSTKLGEAIAPGSSTNKRRKISGGLGGYESDMGFGFLGMCYDIDTGK